MVDVSDTWVHSTWSPFNQHTSAPSTKSDLTSWSDELFNANKKLDEVMADFKLNGSDSAFHSEEEDFFGYNKVYSRERLYMRQSSCPEPSTATLSSRYTTDPYKYVNWSDALYNTELSAESLNRQFTDDQAPPSFSFLADSFKFQPQVQMECRFCKSNGERASVFQRHRLRDRSGRVLCPVLRAFRCPRCSATGDNAHTLKYCPYTSTIERQHAEAMMRSVRMGSSRRRHYPDLLNPSGYPNTGAQPSSYTAPLDPLWAELERKLALDDNQL